MLERDRHIDCWKPIPGTRSLMNICPVVRDKWNRLGVRLVIQNMCVTNALGATWEANCLRIRHSALGPSIVRIIYWNERPWSRRQHIKTLGYTHAGHDILRNQFSDNFIQNFFLQCGELSFVNLDE